MSSRTRGRSIGRATLLLAAAVASLVVAPVTAEAKKAAAKKPAAKVEEKAAPEEKPAPAARKGGADKGAPAGEPGGEEIRRGERVEFDERLIQGQTAKAGAVYLFERMSSDLRSMVKERSSFKEEVVEPVFPAGSAR